MEVICIETEAFYKMVDILMERAVEKFGAPAERWITRDEAMALLNINSLTTIQRLRDEGRIRFAQPSPRKIMYDRLSIEEYLEKNTRETF